MNKLLTIALPFTALLLAGCGNKPPGCADKETVETLQSILVDNVKGLMPRFSGNPNFAQDDPDKIQEGYYQALKVELANVVTNGYNDAAKKNNCQGKLTVSTASGEKLSRDVVYSTQRTEDKDGGFVVEVQAFNPFISGVASDLTLYYRPKRYAGEWKGSYSCAAMDNASTPAQGPFNMPVTLVVDNRLQGKLERTTQGGGIEVIAGEVGPKLRLRGEGRNSPDDTWRTQFEGEIKGQTLTAEGQIEAPPPDGRVLRQCTLSLQHAPR